MSQSKTSPTISKPVRQTSLDKAPKPPEQKESKTLSLNRSKKVPIRKGVKKVVKTQLLDESKQQHDVDHSSQSNQQSDQQDQRQYENIEEEDVFEVSDIINYEYLISDSALTRINKSYQSWKARNAKENEHVPLVETQFFATLIERARQCYSLPFEDMGTFDLQIYKECAPWRWGETAQPDGEQLILLFTILYCRIVQLFIETKEFKEPFYQSDSQKPLKYAFWEIINRLSTVLGFKTN